MYHVKIMFAGGMVATMRTGFRRHREAHIYALKHGPEMKARFGATLVPASGRGK